MSVCIMNCILHLIPRSVFGGPYIFEETWIILTLSIPDARSSFRQPRGCHLSSNHDP